MLNAARISGDFVLLHPGSARVETFWEADRWAEVIHYLHDRGLTRAITGSAAPLGQAHIAQSPTRAKPPFGDLSGTGDLLTLTALIQRARLLVTVDSAPMHFA